jgi:DNA invertase Pin-like site-specific DNA recombinase
MQDHVQRRRFIRCNDEAPGPSPLPEKTGTGYTLIVRKLDRLGRSLHDLITMLDDLKRRGVKFGRKPKLTPQQIDHARRLIENGEDRQQVAALFKVNRTTLYRVLREPLQ